MGTPWAHAGQALVGLPGSCGPIRALAERALVGRALVGHGGPLWAAVGPLWAPLALAGRALVGRALVGPGGPGPCGPGPCGPPGPSWAAP